MKPPFASTSSSTATKKHAGGRATEAGMDFQAEVGTWIAAHILARLPIGGRFGLSNEALPSTIQLETSEGLDDTLVTQDDSSQIDIQSKTKADLSESPSSPLGKTIAQLARIVSKARTAGTTIDPSKVRAVMAVSAAAARTLDNLEKGCRAFDTGGTWASTKAQRSKKEREALEKFEAHARAAWAIHSATPPIDDDFVLMARLFQIVRFSMDEGDDNWREAARALGSRLYGAEAAGDAPLRDLKSIVRGLIGSGAPADRGGLIRALRSKGHNDTSAPNYELDLARLAQATIAELERLAVHTRLPIADGVPILRESQGALVAAITSGSLIVIGEPGAGKTGALVALAQARLAVGDTVVFLSVERFPGVAITADLQSELQLDHPLIDVLASVPGTSRKVLMIDALDAARGGLAEGVFAQLIEAVGTALEAQWTIVASIRTFDLKNGRRYRDAIPGSPPDPTYADTSLAAVRHFQVPRLNDVDLASAGAASPALATLLMVAPDKLRHLLRNVFNLSLAAQLLSDGASPDRIRMVSTQSDLIDSYEDRRLVETSLQQAAAATVGEMVRRRRLAVRKVVVSHDRLDAVIRSGVLTESGDLVSFSHHVLFDHVAGRFFLDWDDPTRLIGQLCGESSIALMLAPGLRFAVERLWRNDMDGKPGVWRFVADIHANKNVDPVLANVALRTATELVGDPADIAGLTQLVADRPKEEPIATMLSRLARFVGLGVDANCVVSGKDMAWATVAEAAATSGLRALSDSARLLLHTLFEKSNLTDSALLEVFGQAARALLALAWASDPPMQQTATHAIRFVGKSYASDPAASRALLDRALRDPHFTAHADKEAIWIAEQIVPIAQADPDFAIEIFRVLYSRDISDNSTSYFGGQPSRIMALSSHRSQDYEHCRYELGRRTGRLLELSAKIGTRAVIEVALGSADRHATGEKTGNHVTAAGRAAFALINDRYARRDWDEGDEGRNTQDDDALAHYVAFLRACPVAAFADSIHAAASEYSSAAVWARLLGVGTERAADTADLLWPYASNLTMLAHSGTMRNAVRFLAATYSRRSTAERTAFETEVLSADLFGSEPEKRWGRRTLGRLLSLVDEAALVTDAMRALRSEMAAANELTGNPSLRAMSISWVPTPNMTRELLARQGVNMDAGVDGPMVAQSEALDELVKQTQSANDAAALATLWRESDATIMLFDARADEFHKNVVELVWNRIGTAVVQIA